MHAPRVEERFAESPRIVLTPASTTPPVCRRLRLLPRRHG